MAAEGGGEAEMRDEGWAGMCLTIPVTCLASRSASPAMWAEGTGTGVHMGRRRVLQLPPLGDCGGSLVSEECAGGQQCLPQSRMAASFRVIPVFACGCGGAELRASPCCRRVLLEGTCPFLR